MLSEAMVSIEMLDLALLWDVSVLTSNLRETGIPVKAVVEACISLVSA
jgi:hypothetical protein